MKKLSIIVLSLFSLCNVFAQQRTQRANMVNINLFGNKNVQVSVDGTAYNLTTGTNKATVSVNNLAVGTHTLALSRTNNNNRRANDITTQFNLRRNFDMTININANGSLELIETRRGAVSGTTRTAMSDVDYNTLTRNLRAQTTTQGRYTFLTNTFSNNNNYFTSRQIVLLLQQVRTEPERLAVAKLAYRTVVDPGNYTQVSSLFTTQARKDELDDYVYYYDEEATVVTENPNTGNGSGMSQSNFTNLYNTIRGQFPISTQVNSINSAFANTANYFTAYQAGQLIQLVSNETYRLQLAKASYRSITDPANFYTVRDLLYSQSSRNELEAFVSGGQSGTGTTIRTAMSDMDYNNLYESINSQFLPFAQMNALTATFNNSAYYFTTAQVKKLIQLVSSETNRLTLAKAAYRNTVDRTNYLQLNDLFTNTSYRNDLNVYVQNYRD